MHPLKSQFTACAMVVAALLPACGQDSSSSKPRRLAPPDAIPESVPVEGGTLTEGTFLGKLRNKREVGAIRISKRPVTVGQYAKCVALRACTAPELESGFCGAGVKGVASLDGASYLLGEPDLPVTCVSLAQAAHFCEWVGGRLPTSIEWQLAARGPNVQRFAWGNSAPTCAQHWRLVFARGSGVCCGHGCDELGVGKTGGHAAGAHRRASRMCSRVAPSSSRAIHFRFGHRAGIRWAAAS